LKALGMPFRT